jgi:hypothetical protein
VTSDSAGAVIMILGSMTLVGSALIARRGHFQGRGRWMIPAWVAIFAVLMAAGLWLDRHH